MSCSFTFRQTPHTFSSHFMYGYTPAIKEHLEIKPQKVQAGNQGWTGQQGSSRLLNSDLEAEQGQSAVGQWNKFKLQLDGEAITSVILQSLWKQNRLKKHIRRLRRRTRKGRREERSNRRKSVKAVQWEEVDGNICQECSADYDEDKFQDAWIGCNNDDLRRWVHYWCAGFDRKASSSKTFTCSYC